MSTDAKALGPTVYQAAVMRAERDAYIPPHVRRVYRWTPLRDVFLDGRGRCWHAGTAALREALPWNPESYERIPPQFWHPRARSLRSREQHEEQHWAQALERADLELPIRNSRRGGVQ